MLFSLSEMFSLACFCALQCDLILRSEVWWSAMTFVTSIRCGNTKQHRSVLAVFSRLKKQPIYRAGYDVERKMRGRLT